MQQVLNYIEQAKSDGDNPYHFDGTVYFGDTQVDGQKLGNIAVSNDVTEYSSNGAVAISGIAMIAGGTGLSGMTLAAPEAGCYCEIVLETITSGTVVVTTAAGVTFDGTNHTATFDAQGDFLRLGYKSATEWKIIENNSVALSLV